MKKLIIITTCSNIMFVKQVLSTLSKEKNDIIIIDDGSKEDYSDIKEIFNVDVIQKPKGKGLTDSWNIGYKIFKSEGYNKCLLSNDDVLFPDKVPNDMWLGLDDYILLGPLSDPVGSGRFMGKFQDVTSYVGGIKDFKDVIYVNKLLQRKKRRFLEIGKDITLPRKEPPYINGFCFSFNRDIINYEFSKDILFDPKNINTGNEKELQRDRLLKGKGVSIKSYIYHYKGCSMNSIDRQKIIN